MDLHYFAFGKYNCTTDILHGHGAANLGNARNPAKFTKTYEIIMAKLDRNLANYISVQHSWNLSRLLGLITCSKLANNIYLETSSLKWANNVPKLLGVDYVAKKLSGTSHVVKSFAFGSFLKHWKNKWLSPLKIVKTASQINAEPIDSCRICPENSHKIGGFYRLSHGEVYPKKSHENPAKWAEFSTNFSLKIRRNFIFFLGLSEALNCTLCCKIVKNWGVI